MGVILLKKQTGISHIFETFHCLTWLCMFLRHQKKNTVYFVKERNSNALWQGRSTKQAKQLFFQDLVGIRSFYIKVQRGRGEGSPGHFASGEEGASSLRPFLGIGKGRQVPTTVLPDLAKNSRRCLDKFEFQIKDNIFKSMFQLLYLGVLCFLWHFYPGCMVISQEGNLKLIAGFLEFHFFLFMLPLSHRASLHAESMTTQGIVLISGFCI